MAIKVARRGAIPPFLVMEVMRAASEHEAAGDDVRHLEVGQPSTGAPSGVVAAAKTALECDALGYTVALGRPELRAAIAKHGTGASFPYANQEPCGFRSLRFPFSTL